MDSLRTVRGSLGNRWPGLLPLDRWDRGFESRWRRGYYSFMFVVCCVGIGPWFRGVLLCVCVCMCARSRARARVSNCVWSRNLNNVAAWDRVEQLRHKKSNSLFVVCCNKFEGYTPLEIWNHKRMYLNVVYGNHSDIDIQSVLVPIALYYFHVEWDTKCREGRRGHEL